MSLKLASISYRIHLQTCCCKVCKYSLSSVHELQYSNPMKLRQRIAMIFKQTSSFMLLHILLFTASGSSADLQEETQALLRWNSELNNSSSLNWSNNTTWSAAAACVKWDGIVCNLTGALSDSGQGTIVSIKITSRILNGTLDNFAFSKLPNLTTLILSDCGIFGTIPYELISSTELQTLIISHNNFSGFIPASFKKLKALNSVDFSYNPNLNGSLPYSTFFCNVLLAPSIENTNLSKNLNCGRYYSSNNGTRSEYRSGPVRQNYTIFAIAVLVPSLFILCVIVAVGLLGRKARRNSNISAPAEASSSSIPELPDTGEKVSSPNRPNIVDDSSLKKFSFKTLHSATNKFSETNKLGEGGFGAVYKGVLRNGEEIAVKMLSSTSIQGDKEFWNEAFVIGKLQHNNLVRLLGCCIHGKAGKLLIYEYMPNRSLDSFIFDDEGRKFLTWTRRFNIIIGVARGILYLHRDSRLKIVHSDIKPSNILLDMNLNPKISDFGTARIYGWTQSYHLTSRIRGTMGYLAPEYLSHGLLSPKIDVFSFGVMLLEIACGKKNNFLGIEKTEPYLLVHAWRLFSSNQEEELIDKLLGSDAMNEAKRCIHIALLCVQEEPEGRPSMADVVLMLEFDTQLPMPTEPPYLMT